MIFFKRVVINKTDKTAVILTYPGIGDIVWHLPFLHALAKVSSHKQIYLYTRSTTLAKDILKYDKKIAKVFYLSETREFLNTIINFPGLINKFKKEKLTTLWIFHRSPRYAIAGKLSKIKNIYGFGFGAQKIWLTSKKNIGSNAKKKDNVFKAKRFMNIHGINFKSYPKMSLPKKIIEKNLLQFKKYPKPWITVGFSCNKTAFMDKNIPYSFYRTWRPEYFAKLINFILEKKTKKTFFLIGAPNESRIAKSIIKKCSNKKKILVSCYSIIKNLSILSQSKCFIGNDSGPLNLAGALGIKSFGLFGASPPIKNIKNILPIVPPGGQVNPHKDGFNPISLEQGMDLIKPELVYKKVKKYI